MKNYVIEKMNENNALDYARVNALAWLQSYKDIVDEDYLKSINTEEKIQKTSEILKENLEDGSRRFLLKVNDEYVGILRVRKTKYSKYSECGELGALYLLDSVKGYGFGKVLFLKAVKELKEMKYNSMIVGCLQDNPANEFYKHMKGKLVNTNLLTLPNKQQIIENLYYYDI